MEQKVKITQIGASYIEYQALSTCAQCQTFGGCSQLRWGRKKVGKIKYTSEWSHLKVGDEINLPVPLRTFWLALGWLCLLPLIGLLGGANLVNYFVDGHEIWHIFGAIIGSSLAYLLAYHKLNR